jgi:hypothetical protein
MIIACERSSGQFDVRWNDFGAFRSQNELTKQPVYPVPVARGALETSRKRSSAP